MGNFFRAIHAGIIDFTDPTIIGHVIGFVISIVSILCLCSLVMAICGCGFVAAKETLKEMSEEDERS